MREILFRGKRMDNGKWAEGYLYEHEPALVGIVSENDVQEPSKWFIARTGFADWNMPRPIGFVEVDPSTVGQYTGLKDKNGNLIFEGDIVHYLYEPGKGYWNSDQHSVIEWNSTGFYMRGIMGTNKYACSTGWLVSTPHGNGKCFEVIGNVHDNPELLKEEAQP